MKLTKVTFTGVDDNTSVHEMKRLSECFPFIEWGVLFSKSRAGTPKYPSSDWVEELFWYIQACPTMHLSAHVCGKWMRDILHGSWAFTSRFGYLYDFERIQINFHGRQNDLGDVFFGAIERFGRRVSHTFIFPYSDNIVSVLDEAYRRGVDAVPLFDISEGKGIEPSEWPDTVPYVKNGYSGGLNPDNLEKNLLEIAKKAIDRDVWIDMETGVRSTDNRFDFSKVLQCIEIIVKLADKGDILT